MIKKSQREESQVLAIRVPENLAFWRGLSWRGSQAMTSELELKLQIPDSQLSAVRARLATRSAQRVRLCAIYFDTPDAQLAQSGAVIRLRLEGKNWVQTVKVSDSKNVLSRLEHNAPRTGGAEPALDLSLHTGTPAGDALEHLLQALAPETGLQEVFRTDVWRTHRLQRLRGGSVELALDVGEIRSGTLTWPVQELEIEAVRGGAALVIDAATQWISKFDLWIDTRSKSLRGHRLWSARQGKSVDLRRPMMGRPTPAQQGLRTLEHPLIRLSQPESGPELETALVKPLLSALMANASEIAGNTYNDEHVHQLRVSLRRLRSVARLADRWMHWPEPVLNAVVELFRTLGQARDRTVVNDLFGDALAKAGCPLTELPAPATLPAANSLLQALRSREVNMAWLWLLRTECDAQGGVTIAQASNLLNQRLQRWASEIEQAGSRFLSLTEDEKHDLRKRVKRLRYAMDSCAVLETFGLLQPRREFAEALAQAQTSLGQFCDFLVARDLWSKAVEQDPRAWFAVGWLSAEITTAEPECHRSLKRMGKIDRRWRSLP